MSSPLNCCIMLLDSLFVCPCVHLSVLVLLPRRLANGSSNLDETYVEYSSAPVDDLIRFWRSKVNETQKMWFLCLHHLTVSAKAICFVRLFFCPFPPFLKKTASEL